MRRPVAREAENLLALREAAARWQQARGIRQWEPGEVLLRDISRQVGAGEWFVHGDDGSIRGALRLLWSDPDTWGERPEGAGYVHGLVVDRTVAPPSLGLRLLDWAAAETGRAGRQFLRLDCVESNARLRRYYREQGFREVGRRDFPNGWHPVVLLERETA